MTHCTERKQENSTINLHGLELRVRLVIVLQSMVLVNPQNQSCYLQEYPVIQPAQWIKSIFIFSSRRIRTQLQCILNSFCINKKHSSAPSLFCSIKQDALVRSLWNMHIHLQG
ncbi:hypothetical protein Patl1_34227 [Pistacia atlantica]|uniref:Uncharacterized protein n=1 Tax=Pistacia atlantica TaxID=434234 RepID=A0ACC0ZRW4_9ROSI|nr:hypothetical protein Patl1_34227 [Pistacia atlantica]